MNFKKHILFLLISVLCFSCGRDIEHKNKKVFRFNQFSGITSLDPAFAKDLANIWSVHQIFNGLVQLNDRLEVVPCIAKRWEISKDGLTYTFFLRKDVRFHDHRLFKEEKGRIVVAHDFVYSFNRLISSVIASPGAWIFNDKIVLPEARQTSPWAGLGKTVPFLALNDTVFQIHLTNPFPPFLGLLSMQYCSVVPYEVAEYFGKDFRKNPVGTGPFKFKIWEESIKLVLLKNENYFETEGDQRLPYIDAVAISFLSDKSVAFFEFIKGNFDFFSGVDGSIKDNLLTREGELQVQYHGKFKMESFPFLNTEYLGILIDESNPLVKNHPLRLKIIRQAINYAIDRKKMITYLRNNIGTPATSGFIPVGLSSFESQDVNGYEYNPQKTRQLLIEAGYPEGRDLPNIMLYTNASYKDLCEFVQKQLSEVKINIDVEVIPPATLREMRDNSKVNFFRASWVADYADAESFLALFYSKNFCPDGPNFTHFYNAKFDSLYELAKSEFNEKKRYEYYKQMDQIVINEAPVVPLFYDKSIRLVQNNIKGLGSNSMNLLTLKNVKIEGKIPEAER